MAIGGLYGLARAVEALYDGNFGLSRALLWCREQPPQKQNHAGKKNHQCKQNRSGPKREEKSAAE